VGRALDDAERAVLRRLLAADFDGVAELRAQADRANVAGRCACGCPSIELTVPDDVPRSACPAGPAPVEGRAGTHAIILLLDDGRLSYLELVHVDDHPPRTWPAAADVSLVVR
jgi:hypothetical protein